MRTAHHVQQPRLAGSARSPLDHASAGVRLVPRVHRRVPLVAAQGGQRGREEPVLLLADVPLNRTSYIDTYTTLTYLKQGATASPGGVA